MRQARSLLVFTPQDTRGVHHPDAAIPARARAVLSTDIDREHAIRCARGGSSPLATPLRRCPRSSKARYSFAEFGEQRTRIPPQGQLN